MKTVDFNKIVEKQLEMCENILIKKTEEYVLDNNDRFKAFKLEWLKQGVNAKAVLWGQMVKHLSSIYDMCMIDNVSYDKCHYKEWNEKITDTINYLILLRGIVDENISK